MKGGGHARGIAAHARRLLARREELARQLAEVDAELDQARRSFSTANGHLIPIRVESFRMEVSR